MPTYYIGPSGNNANSGTSSGSPWATFTYAMTQMSSGDELRVLDGTYNQKIIPISDITVTGHTTPSSAIIRGISGVNHIVDITGVSNVTISNLQVSYNPAHADPPLSDKTIRNYWVNIGLTASNIIIDSLVIDKASVTSIPTAIADYNAKYRERGIHTQGSNVEIKNCDIRGINAGIVIKGSGTNVYIHDNNIYEVVQSCIVSQDSYGTIRYLRIENNELHDAYTEDGIQFQAGDTPTSIATRGAIVRGNLIYGNRENGIDLKGASDIVIENNVLQGNVGSSDETKNDPNRQAAGAISRGSGTESQYIIIRNNAIYDSHKGIKLAGDYTKVYHNDVIYNNRDYTGTDSSYIDPNGLEFVQIDNQYTGDNYQGWMNNVIGGAKNSSAVKLRSNGIFIDNNIYFPYTNSDDVIYTYYAASPTEYTGLAAWQAFLTGQSQVSGKEVNSQEISTFAGVDYATLSAKPSTLLALSDFLKNITSPAYQTGMPLTTVVSQINNKSFTVEDASWFSRYFSDTINVGGQTVVITDINYSTNTISVSSNVSVSPSDDVFWMQASPNIGILGDPALINAAFTTSIDGNCVPTTVYFTDTSSSTNTITDWLWNFGDGNTSTDQNTSHSYATAGTYTVTLTVTSSDGSDVASKVITVVDCETFNCDNGNIILNGTFDTDLTSWALNPPASATSNALWNAGEAQIITTVYSTGTLDFSQFNLNIVGGQEYNLSFDVYTSGGPQTLQVRLRTEGSPYTTNGTYESYSIDTTPQTISTAFIADFDDPTARLMFIMNYIDTTFIDNVCLTPANPDVEPVTKLPSVSNKYSMNSIGTVGFEGNPGWIDLFPDIGKNLLGKLLISYNIFSGLGQAIDPITQTILSWNIDTGSYSVDTFAGINVSSGTDTRLAEYGLQHPVEFGDTRGSIYWDLYYVEHNALYGTTIVDWPDLLDKQYAYAVEL